MDDLAWTPGLPAWSPLVQVLHPARTRIEPPPIAAPAPARIPPGEPATAKQKAFLSYMGIAFPSDMTKEQAALLAHEAMENPKLNARVLQWNDDRLRLHPDIFDAEAQAKKDDRANHFFAACQHEGSDRLMDVTKAHCHVLVGYLDVNFPNWDANESEAVWNYFFPAVAEKFPQLVRKQWRGKLKYPDGPKVSAEILQHGPVARSPGGHSPIGTLIRGGNESVYQVHCVTGRGVTWHQAAKFAVAEVCGRHDDARVGEVRRLQCHIERDGAVRLTTELAISVKYQPVRGATA